MAPFTLHWDIQAHDHGKMVREFLKENDISKAALTDIKFKGGKILVNGQNMTVRKELKAGDKLSVVFPIEKRSEGIKSESIPLTIIYEDEYIMVINKPAGMNTIPSREHPSGSLANAIVGYYELAGLQSTTHVVTRLDRDTSGLVLVAKHRHVHHLFSKQQKIGTVKRTYEAIAAGIFTENKGIIEKPIGRKNDSIIEREVHPLGQYACTHFRVKNRFSSFTHLQLQLETGRTHQIRVHLSYIGHPILGDDLYGGPVEKIKRQALHCRKICFYHPFLKRNLFFEAPLPEDMKSLLACEEL